jgi:hypothetical protein
MGFIEEIGDFSEFGDYYDHHMMRWYAIQTYDVWFGANSSILRLFLFAWACGYTVEIDLVHKN